MLELILINTAAVLAVLAVIWAFCTAWRKYTVMAQWTRVANPTIGYSTATQTPLDDPIVGLATHVLFDSGLQTVISRLIVKLDRGNGREIPRTEVIEGVVSGDITESIEAAGIPWPKALGLIRVILKLLGAGTDA